MNSPVNPMLVIAAVLNALAALLHVGCILFGASWYRFFGAGEKMAALAEAGDWRPTVITTVIVLVLSLWAAYASSGAGMITKLPLLRMALCTITLIYLLRAAIPLLILVMGRVIENPAFWLWSSTICLAFGLIHLIGVIQQWQRL